MSQIHPRGLFWAFSAALGIAGFVIPWKLASGLGESRINTLILLSAAALCNTVFTLLKERGLPRVTRFDWIIAAALATFTLAGNLASAEAIARLSPALLTVVQRSEIILVALLAWPLIGERIDLRFALGALIAGCGLLVLYDPLQLAGGGAASPQAAELRSAEVRAAGIAWAAASAVCFSLMAVVTRLFISRIDPVSVNGLRLWLSVALWFAFNGVPDSLLAAQPRQVGYACLAGFFGPFFGRLCMMTSAKYVEARITTLATLAAPPITLLLAYLILADFPEPREIFGGLIMLLGIAIPVMGWRPRRAGAQ